MAKKEEKDIIYQSPHERDLQGCLPFFILLALALVALLFFFIRVEEPKEVHSSGRGQVFVRKDSMLHSYLSESSPLGLSLPRFADPAYQQIPHTQLPITRRVELESLPAARYDKQSTPTPLLSAPYLLSLPAQLEETSPWAEKKQPPSPAKPANQESQTP